MDKGYIKREAVLTSIKNSKAERTVKFLAEVLVRTEPTADVVEVKHGRWVNNGIPESMLSKCSVCDYSCGAYSFNYCPQCGAKMDGGAENA